MTFSREHRELSVRACVLRLELGARRNAHLLAALILTTSTEILLVAAYGGTEAKKKILLRLGLGLSVIPPVLLTTTQRAGPPNLQHIRSLSICPAFENPPSFTIPESKARNGCAVLFGTRQAGGWTVPSRFEMRVVIYR